MGRCSCHRTARLSKDGWDILSDIMRRNCPKCWRRALRGSNDGKECAGNKWPKNAPSKNLYALNYTNELLKKIHKPFEELSDRQIKKARQQAKKNGPGLPVKKVVSHRMHIDLVKLDHFVTLIDRPYFYQDVLPEQLFRNILSRMLLLCLLYTSPSPRDA